MSDNYCCDAFKENAGALLPTAGGWAPMYPTGMRPLAPFEHLEGEEWAINGCCGGGCYVVVGMKYCPFCGEHLVPPPEQRGEPNHD